MLCGSKFYSGVSERSKRCQISSDFPVWHPRNSKLNNCFARKCAGPSKSHLGSPSRQGLVCQSPELLLLWLRFLCPCFLMGTVTTKSPWHRGNLWAGVPCWAALRPPSTRRQTLHLFKACAHLRPRIRCVSYSGGSVVRINEGRRTGVRPFPVVFAGGLR